MTEQIERRDVLRGIGAVGAAGMLGLAGCVGGDDDSGDDNASSDDGGDGGESGGEIQLGLVMGVTGGLSTLGPPIRSGAQGAVEQINNGDTDWTVETRFEDTETAPGPGQDGAQAIADAGFPMFVGALASGVSIPVANNVTLEQGLIQMSPASTAVDYESLDEDIDGTFTWRTAPSDAFQGQVAADIARNRIGADSVSTIGRSDAYGRGLTNQFADAFSGDGGTVEEELEIDPSRSSFTAQLETALGPDPDMLYIVAFTEEGQNLMRDFYQDFDRPDLPIVVSDGLQAASLAADSGQDVETFSNVTGTGPGISDDVATGLEAAREQVGEDIDKIFVRESYDAAAVLSLARVAAGSDDPRDIGDAIPQVTSGDGIDVSPENLVEGINTAADGDDIVYSGVSRPLEFNENGSVATPVYEYYEWGTDDNGDPTLQTIDIISGTN
jgi:ABC-type branched-chain amino acid transport systems, periplasmic component